MDGNESSHRLQDNDGLFQSPSSSNRSKRHSSFTKPFHGLKRMGSKLVPSNWSKDSMKYEALDSTTNLLESPPKLPGIPDLLNKDNKSKESFLTSLDKLAEHPKYQSNPAPGLGYKKPEPVTHSDDNPDALATKLSPGLLENSPQQMPSTRKNSSSFIPRYSNAPILFPSLMAPIRPGEQPQRGMARSSTAGTLEQRKAAYKEARSTKGNAANYMRPTSSSIARRSSVAPSPTVSPSTKQGSAEHPLGLKIERTGTQVPRLSSSNSSRALRANVTSDLPFRELYGSKAPDEIKVQTASRPLRFMEDAYDELQKSKIPRGTTSLQTAHQAAPTSTDSGSEITVAHHPGQVVDLNEVKSPEFLVTPNPNPSEAAEASEAALHDSPGHTPLILPGLKHMSFPAGELGKSKLGQNALDDSPLTEPETTQYEQGESSVKRGKQRERVGVDEGDSFATHNRQHEIMGFYDEEGYTAPAKQGESAASCEGDTIIRGGIGDTDTNVERSIVMRANTASPILFLEEEEDDDPRNVSKALSRFPHLSFLLVPIHRHLRIH